MSTIKYTHKLIYEMCQICINEPGSHSFEYIGLVEDKKVFYTCPAKATKYWDTEGILNHYDEILKSNGDHPWIWLFDGEGFGLNHSMQIATALGILKLLKEKYGKYLVEIRIVKPTIYIKSFYRLIYPFLDQNIINIVKWYKE